jgi:hypothetical protein
LCILCPSTFAFPCEQCRVVRTSSAC